MTTLAQNQSFEQTAIIASSSLSILNNTIRMVDGLYSLNDLHKASGNDDKHQPTFFLRNQQTKDLIVEIEAENQSANLQTAVKSINGGLQRGTYVCRELVYAYAMWISAKFHLLVIRAFDAMHTQKTQPTFNIAETLSQTLNQISKGNRKLYMSMYNGLTRRFTINRLADIPQTEIHNALAIIYSFAIEWHRKHTIDLKLNDGEYYFVIKDGVVFWQKRLKEHCNDIPSNTLQNPTLMLEHIREVVGEFVGQQALEHKPVEHENNLMMISRDTTNKVMDYFAALRHEINRLDGKLPIAPDLDKETIVRAVVTSIVDSRRMLLAFDYLTGKPNISFVPNDCFVTTRDNLAQVIGGGDGIPKKYLPDIIKAAVNRLSGS